MAEPILRYCAHCGKSLSKGHSHNAPYCSLRCAVFSRIKAGKTDQCWPWVGAKDRRGYGQFHFDDKKYIASRAVYELTHGPIGDSSLFVCHTCDNPPCCNPIHLWLGTAADNHRDMRQKGRMKIVHRVGEGNGNSKLTADQVREIRRLYAAGGITHRELGARFGIGASMSRHIVRRDFWKHVD